MRLWRIEKVEYADLASKGIGAYAVGGRWTSAGTHAVYASESIALCMLEVLVHSPTPKARKVPRVLFRIDTPDTLLKSVSLPLVPKPFIPSTPFEESQPVGDAWIRAANSAGLVVPSAIIGLEFNVVLNPAHPDYAKVKWSKPVAIALDERLNTTGVGALVA
jgi:RES domain-containing protein